MKPAEHDITIYRGDTFELFVRLRDKVWNETSGEYEPGAYKDLTGWTGSAQIRETVDASSATVEFTVTLGNQSTAPGSAFVSLSSAQTSALTIASGVWDLQFVTDATETFTYLAGKVTVTKDVTRT